MADQLSIKDALVTAWAKKIGDDDGIDVKVLFENHMAADRQSVKERKIRTIDMVHERLSDLPDTADDLVRKAYLELLES